MIRPCWPARSARAAATGRCLRRPITFDVVPDGVYDVTLSGGPAGATVRVYKISSAGRLSFIGDGPEVARHTDAGGAYVARVTGGDGSTASYTLTVQMPSS